MASLLQSKQMVSLSLFWHRLESIESLSATPAEWRRKRGIILWGFEVEGKFIPIQLLGSQDMHSALQGVLGKIKGGLLTLWNNEAMLSNASAWHKQSHSIAYDPKNIAQFVDFAKGQAYAELVENRILDFRFTSATLAKNISSVSLQRCLFQQLAQFDMPYKHPKPKKAYEIVHIGNHRVCELFSAPKEG